MTGSSTLDPTEENVTPSMSLIKLARDWVGSIDKSFTFTDL